MWLPDDEIEIQHYRTVPVTFGMEIEQPPTLIQNRLINKFYSDCHDHSRGFSTFNPTSPYDWCKDGSGPRETNLPPSTHILSQLKKFITYIGENNALWDWVNEYSGGSSIIGGGLSACGSHIHFRLREDMIENHLINDAWATLYNTILEVSMLMMPMLCHGSRPRNSFCFRRGAAGSGRSWADLKTTRYSGPTFGRHYIHGTIPNGRHYWFLTPNKRTGKVLTLEIRANEAHPSIVYCFASYIIRIVREVFNKGMVSPKLANRIRTTGDINGAYQISAQQNQNIYRSLSQQVSNIKFLPGRGIPKLKLQYDSYLKCFDDILIKYHSTGSLISSRTSFLFRQRGEPWKNPNAIWNVLTSYKGDFKWDQPNIWSPDETGGRLPKEPKQ